MNKFIKSFRTMIGKESEIGKDTLAERCTILAAGLCTAMGNGDIAERCNHVIFYTDDQMTILCLKSERGRGIIADQMRLTGVAGYKKLIAGISNGGIEIFPFSMATDRATRIPQLDGTSFIVEERIRNLSCILTFADHEFRLVSGRHKLGRKSCSSPKERFIELPEVWGDVSRDQGTIFDKDGNWFIKADKVLPSMQLNEDEILEVERPVVLTGKGVIKIGSNHTIHYEIRENEREQNA